jgi:pimeloyl-ACP methyl ester carboxylesterase
VLTAAAVVLVAAEPAGAALRFRDCDGPPCARLSVPLDHSGAVPGRLALLVRHDSLRPPRGVTLVLPGAAGAPAPSSNVWEELMPRQDIVTLEPRGTRRGELRCRDLEAATFTDAGREAAACAVLLGEKRRFFRAADTVEDIELLRAELGVERLTIVAPGYGSYVAQRYALRHPDRVKRMILPSVVDAAGPDPLFRDSVSAARRILDELCRSDCERFTRDAQRDTRTLVTQLASAPLRGSIVGPEGHARAARLSRQELLFILLSSDDNPIVRADYPAAVVSALRGDPAPLLRLKRRATAATASPYPRFASAAAAAAATCEEVRFPWAWHASPAERAEAAHRAEIEMDPGLAAPFDPGTLVRSEPMRLCARWPTASPGPPAEPGPMPDVPVLLLADGAAIGTPVETALRTAARFPSASLLVTEAEFDTYDECRDRAVRRFMRGEPVQRRCPDSGPLIPATAPIPASLRELAPVRGLPGRRGRLVRAVSASVGDLIDDYFARLISDPDGLFSVFSGRFRAGGLRGGSVSISSGDETTILRRYEFVPGVRLSGRWDSGSDRIGLRVDGPGGLDGVVRLLTADEELAFRVRGRLGGRRVNTRVRIESRLLSIFAEAELARAAAALPWRVCAVRHSLSPSSWRGFFSPRPPTPRCRSSAAAPAPSPARD